MDSDKLAFWLGFTLREAHAKIVDIVDGGEIERQGKAFGDLDSDTELKADRLMGELIRDAILAAPEIFDARRVTVEGLGDFDAPGGAGSLWYCVDPLDGSLNWKKRSGTIGLPVTACVTALRRVDGATFGDVLAAAVRDLRSADVYAAWLEAHGSASRVFTEVNGERIEPDPADEAPFDLGSMIVFGESYYPDNRELLARAFAGRKGWLRSPGSAAYEMASVASGVGDGFICGTQKQHELGAGMLLVQGAGGVVTDFDGRSLAGRTFDFTTQIPVVMGRTPRIHRDLLESVRGAVR